MIRCNQFRIKKSIIISIVQIKAIRINKTLGQDQFKCIRLKQLLQSYAFKLITTKYLQSINYPRS